jgi:hypothetical protein
LIINEIQISGLILHSNYYNRVEKLEHTKKIPNVPGVLVNQTKIILGLLNKPDVPGHDREEIERRLNNAHTFFLGEGKNQSTFVICTKSKSNKFPCLIKRFKSIKELLFESPNEKLALEAILYTGDLSKNTDWLAVDRLQMLDILERAIVGYDFIIQEIFEDELSTTGNKAVYRLLNTTIPNLIRDLPEKYIVLTQPVLVDRRHGQRIFRENSYIFEIWKELYG